MSMTSHRNMLFQNYSNPSPRDHVLVRYKLTITSGTQCDGHNTLLLPLHQVLLGVHALLMAWGGPGVYSCTGNNTQTILS